MRIAAVLSVLNCRLTLDCGQQRALALGLFPNDPHGGEENERLRNSSVEITKLVGDMHPLAFTGDPGEIGLSIARVVDALGGMFALLRKRAPKEAPPQAMKPMVEGALCFASEAQTAADGLRGQV